MIQTNSKATHYTFRHVHWNWTCFLRNNKVCGAMFKNIYLEVSWKNPSQGFRASERTAQRMSSRMDMNCYSKNRLRHMLFPRQSHVFENNFCDCWNRRDQPEHFTITSSFTMPFKNAFLQTCINKEVKMWIRTSCYFLLCSWNSSN